jgi:hypothetical protein
LCNYFCYPFSFKKFSCVRRIVRVFCFLLLLLGKQRHVSWFVFFFSTWVIFFFLFMSALAMQTLFSHIRSCHFFHGSISFGLWRWVFIFILHNGLYFSTTSGFTTWYDTMKNNDAHIRLFSLCIKRHCWIPWNIFHVIEKSNFDCSISVLKSKLSYFKIYYQCKCYFMRASRFMNSHTFKATTKIVELLYPWDDI